MSVAGVFLIGVFRSRMSDARFIREYEKAQLEDLRYARKHPGCTLEDTHRNRDRVLRKYGRD